MTEKKGCYWCKHRRGLSCDLLHHGATWSLEMLKTLQHAESRVDFYIGECCKDFEPSQDEWNVS